MKIRVLTRRALLAFEALSGRLDDVHSLASRISELSEMNTNLRGVIGRIHGERQYWYNLWTSMGREFENAQNAMIEEIDNLRREVGKPEGKWEELVKKAFSQKYVTPAKHPVEGIRTEVKQVECPPQPPAEAGNEH